MVVEKHKCDRDHGEVPEKCARKTVGKLSSSAVSAATHSHSSSSSASSSAPEIDNHVTDTACGDHSFPADFQLMSLANGGHSSTGENIPNTFFNPRIESYQSLLSPEERQQSEQLLANGLYAGPCANGGKDDKEESLLTAREVREEPTRFENATFEDVFVEESELQWMMISEEKETPSPTPMPTPAELRLVLPSADGSVLHDADFGARISVVTLAEHHHPDNDQTYYVRDANSQLFNIFWLRKQAHEAPSRPNYKLRPPEPLSAGVQWLSCFNDDRFLFGIESKVKFILRKELVQIYDVLSKEYESRFILRAVTVTPDPVTFFLDAYEPNGQLRGQRGEFVQQNSLGEIYLGWRLRVREHTTTAVGAKIQEMRHAKIYARCLQDREALKLINCSSSQPVRSVTNLADLETVLSQKLSNRKENIAQEIRGMSFLRKLGERLSLPFHDYSSLLQHPGRFIAVCADFAPDRCLFHFVNTHKAREGYHLSEREAKHVMRQVCTQLAAMHAHGFAHQDISSENILLRRPYSYTPTIMDLLTLECVLMDYGQSCAVPFCKHTQRYLPVRAKTGHPVGKPAFFAPELVQKQQQGTLLNGEYDAFAVDVFQLGITMFIMLLGRYPFKCEGSVIEQERAAFFRLLEQEKLHELKIGNSSTPVSSLLSEESLDLLRQLLCFHPETRPSVETVLRHRWLQK